MTEERNIQPPAKEIDQAKEVARSQAEAKWREKNMFDVTHKNRRTPEELTAYENLQKELEALKTAEGFSQEDVRRDFDERMKVLNNSYYDLIDGEWNEALASRMKAITDSDNEVNYHFFHDQIISDLIYRDYDGSEQMRRVPHFLRLVGYLWGENKKADLARKLGGVISRKMDSMDQLVTVASEAHLPTELQQRLVFAYLTERARHLGRPRTSADDVRSTALKLNQDFDEFNTALAKHLEDDLRLLTSVEPAVNRGIDPDIDLIADSIEKYIQFGLPRTSESSYIQFARQIIEERKRKSPNPQRWDDVFSQLQLA